jgi:hypothetical protein
MPVFLVVGSNALSVSLLCLKKYKELAFTARYPFTESIGLYPLIGSVYWESKYNYFSLGSVNKRQNDQGLDLVFGLGADFKLSDSLSAYMELTRLDIDVDTSQSKGNISGQMISMSILFIL